MATRRFSSICLAFLVCLFMGSLWSGAGQAAVSEHESLRAPKDASIVVFYRPPSPGVTRKTIVYDGDKPLMTFHKKHRYTYITSPGKHLFKLFSINSVDFMDAELLPGRTYFVLLTSSMFEVRFKPEHSENYGFGKLMEEVNYCEERRIPESRVREFVEDHGTRLDRLNRTGLSSFLAEPESNRKHLKAKSGIVIPNASKQAVSGSSGAVASKITLVPKLSAPKDSAVVVFYRPSGMEFPFRTVIFDGIDPVVSLAPQTMYAYNCSPGKHLLKLFSLEQKSVDVLEANVIAGRTYFLEIHPQVKELEEEEHSGGEDVPKSDSGYLYSVHFIPQMYPAKNWSEILAKLDRCEDASDQTNLSEWTISHSEEIRSLDQKGVTEFLGAKENAAARLPEESGVIINKDGRLS